MSTIFYVIAILLTFIALIGFIAGMINPKKVMVGQPPEQQTRKSIAKMTAVMLVLAGISGIVSSATAPSKPVEQAAPQVAMADQSTPEGQIQRAIVDTATNFTYSTNNIKITKIEINPLNGQYNVNVWAKLTGESWSAESALKSIELYSIGVYKGAYTSGQPIARVSFIVMADFTDPKGNASEAKAFQSELRVESAKTFNWDNAEAIDPKVLNKGAFTHPAFRVK